MPLMLFGAKIVETRHDFTVGGWGVFRTHKSIFVACVAVALPPLLMRPRLLEELVGRSWLF